MSRRGFTVLALSLLAGCAAKKPAPQPVVIYEDQPAGALAFAAPVRDDGILLEEIGDRSLRRPRAFVGFPTLIREYYWVRTDDRMLFGPGYSGHGYGYGDRYERRAISTRVGAIER